MQSQSSATPAPPMTAVATRTPVIQLRDSSARRAPRPSDGSGAGAHNARNGRRRPPRMTPAESAEKAKRVLESLCHPNNGTPQTVRDLFAFMVDRQNVPTNRRRSYSVANGSESILKGCEYMGGGSEGYVLKYSEPPPYCIKRVLKVREITSENGARSLLREIANCLFVTEPPSERQPAVPFLGRMVDWHLWNGYLADGATRGNTSVATTINELLGRTASDDDYVIDFVEFVPDVPVQEKIYDLWLRAISAEERAVLERSVMTNSHAPMENRYAASRANHFRNRQSEMPQMFATITQSCEGSSNLSDLLQMKTPGTEPIAQPAGSCWTAEKHWMTFSSHCLVIIHQLHTLQNRYHMMHLDFQTGNIVLRDVSQIHAAYSHVWRPVVPPNGSGRGAIISRPITIEELGHRLPVIVDLSQASFNFAAIADRLRIRATADGQDEASRTARLAIGRNHIYSRTTDLRRLGLYFCYALVRNVGICYTIQKQLVQKHATFYRDFAALIRENIGYKFTRVAMDMMAVPQSWLELAKTNPNGIAQKLVENDMFGPSRSQTVQRFIANIIRLQAYLALVLKVTGPRYADDFMDSVTLVAHMRKIEQQQHQAGRIVMDLVFDLNPMTNFIICEGLCAELANDPLLTENIIRWDIWAVPSAAAAAPASSNSSTGRSSTSALGRQ